tara:strand:+ start:407 stop:1276 length:870 start_codon:yes stop_codon:yes gene_type:complete
MSVTPVAKPAPVPGAYRIFATLCVAAGILLTATAGVLAAPKADLWQRWAAQDPDSTARIAHGDWTRLLSAYARPSTDGVTRFAYGDVTATDRGILEKYIARLEATPITTFNRREQFAYWANFYNALTIKVILDHYPVASIRDIDISPGFFADGPWGAKLATVEGEKISLDDIEHRILRPIWKDPRIHYVVNCASIGCPDLPPVALTPENTETLLNELAERFVNHPRGVSVLDGRIVVSSIYSWFEADFGGTEAGVLDHVRRFASSALAGRLKGRSSYDDHAYNWKLNGL